MTGNLALIGVGSNIDPEKNIQEASVLLQNEMRLLQESTFRYTAPLIFPDQPKFLNGAFLVKTGLSKDDLKIHLKNVERSLGRIKRKNKNGPRRIDLDIVIFNREIVDSDLYKREFLKQAVLELIPTLKKKWQIANRVRYRSELQSVVRIIRAKFNRRITSIIGGGHWFCDQEGSGSEIKIILVSKKIKAQELKDLNRELQENCLSPLGSTPLRLFQLTESRFKEQLEVFDSTSKLSDQISALNFYHTLYPKEKIEVPIPSSTFESLDYRKTLTYIHSLWKKEVRTKKDQFWWQFLRTYFYYRLVKLKFERGQIESYSFFMLKEFFQESAEDLIHKAFYYRYADIIVDDDERNAFQKTVLEELQTQYESHNKANTAKESEMNQMLKEGKEVSRDDAIKALKTLITYIGDDPEREGLKDTPERVLRSFDEIYGGYSQDPNQILQKSFSTSSEEMVVLSNIELYSTCEHHMLPFIGKCHIAYIPNRRVIGLSKLARMMETFARRLQIQEELTQQIANTLHDQVHALGVAVMIEAKHLCMSCRGINKQQSTMITTAMLGQFKEDQDLKRDFFRSVEKSV